MFGIGKLKTYYFYLIMKPLKKIGLPESENCSRKTIDIIILKK